MQNLKILNNKEVKKIKKELKKNYGSEEDLDFVFFKSSKDKIYLLGKKFAELNDKGLRINNLGLYFGKFEKDGIRLSIEGAQMIKPKKNIIDLDKNEIKEWMNGKDIKCDKEIKGYAIIKYNQDAYGVGKIKDGMILNFVPKFRRIKSEAV
ncbi:MAG: hypothetical protein U9Q69_06235 [Nanoarchaeota archaeon]|nr:hypothetical protein [Nanoarchaeota archaeon]